MRERRMVKAAKKGIAHMEVKSPSIAAYVRSKLSKALRAESKDERWWADAEASFLPLQPFLIVLRALFGVGWMALLGLKHSTTYRAAPKGHGSEIFARVEETDTSPRVVMLLVISAEGEGGIKEY